MKRFPILKLPKCRLRISRSGVGEERVWDDLRCAWLVLTPEEWVRRHVCGYLVSHAGIPPSHIVQEYPVCISGMPQRADIVVKDNDGNALILVECKAPGVAVDNSVYAQAVRYNTEVGAIYIMITNGLMHYIFRKSPEGVYEKCGDFPSLAEYFKKSNR